MTLNEQYIRNEIDNLLETTQIGVYLDKLISGDRKNDDNWNLLSVCLPSGYYVSSGCSRSVIICDEWDFVLKLPLLLYRDEERIDYNESEYKMYCAAQSAGLDKYFAPMVKIDYKYNGIDFPFYAMAFCEIDEEQMSCDSYDYQFQLFCDENNYEDSEETREEFERYHSDFGDSDSMREFASNIWGWREGDDVFDLLDEHHIGDTHAGNFGYLNGNLVITDYAGYCTVFE